MFLHVFSNMKEYVDKISNRKKQYLFEHNFKKGDNLSVLLRHQFETDSFILKKLISYFKSIFICQPSAWAGYDTRWFF